MALLKAADPNLSPDDIRVALERRATKHGNGGIGIVNAFASLNHVLPARERAAFTITPVACGVYAYLTDKLESWRSNRAGKAGEGYWWEEFTYDSQVDGDLYTMSLSGPQVEEPVLIERYGKPAGVLISPERHEELLAALEELEDIRAFDDAMAEEGDNIPWDQVKADLGWT